MLTARLYMLQRITALIMAPLVIGHLVLMIYAVQGGLSAAEILGRTQGSILWALYYGLFVVAAALHGAIGMRTILAEWGHAATWAHPQKALSLVTLITFLALAVLGLTAVYGVVAS